MEKPEWSIGNEKRFYDFISNLGGEKIVLVSHTDMDGISSAKIVNEVVKADDIFFINYSDINGNLVQVLKERKAKKVIFTDLFFKAVHFPIIKEIESFSEILIIDHHTPEFDTNSDRTVLVNSQGFCATYLCYYLFNKVQDVSYFDWLVACASIADVAYLRSKEFMESTMGKYGDKLEIMADGHVRKNGRFWDYQWKLSLATIVYADNLKFVFDSIKKEFEVPEELQKETSEVEGEYLELLGRFEKEKKETKDLCFWEFKPKHKISSFVINEISFRQHDKTFVFLSPAENGYKFSTRRQDGKIDLNKFCQELVNGFENSSAGGHPRASAGNFPAKYLAEFKKRLGVI